MCFSDLSRKGAPFPKSRVAPIPGFNRNRGRQLQQSQQGSRFDGLHQRLRGGRGGGGGGIARHETRHPFKNLRRSTTSGVF